MHYTPCCGVEALYPAEHQYKCPKCGKTYYDNPKAAVAIILVDDKKQIIIGRRAHQPYIGKIDFPGGFLDVGEGFEEALKRELKEESALTLEDIKDLSYLGSAHDYYPWEGAEISVASVY